MRITKAEFYEFADIWYQRAHRLRDVWQDENETAERKEKAFRLWNIMKNRVLKITQIATKINQVKLPKFENGGVVLD